MRLYIESLILEIERVDGVAFTQEDIAAERVGTMRQSLELVHRRANATAR